MYQTVKSEVLTEPPYRSSLNDDELAPLLGKQDTSMRNTIFRKYRETQPDTLPTPPTLVHPSKSTTPFWALKVQNSPSLIIDGAKPSLTPILKNKRFTFAKNSDLLASPMRDKSALAKIKIRSKKKEIIYE
jgi:hypothetical protein